MNSPDRKSLNILSGIYSPFNRFNGSVVFCRNLYKEIIAKGNIINFVGLETENPMETEMKLHLLKGELVADGDSQLFKYAVKNIRNTFEQILNTENIDIIHGHHLTFPPAAAFAEMKIDCPLVITSHASDIEFAQKNPSHREHVKKSLQMADKVVLLSRNLIPLIEELKPDMAFNKIAIIPLGVDEFFFTSEKPLKEDDIFTILYSGRLTKEKGVAILLHALHKIPGAILRIAGKGDYEKELKELAAKMGLEKRVTFLGFLNREELKAEYRNATILAVPSQGIEGIPQVCLEAMANYLPVIATDTGGISEFLGNASLIVPSGKPDEVIDGIIKLNQDKSLREELALKGREKVEEYTWERIAHLYLSLFKSLL